MGLQIIKSETNYDFIRLRKIAFLVSGIILLVGLVSLAVKGGPRYGIDFAGGITIQTKFDQDIDFGKLKSALQKAEIPSLTVQRFGMESHNEYLIRVANVDIQPESLRNKVKHALETGMSSGFQIQRLEMVGPKVGQELQSKALEALFYAVLLISIYISGRFEARWLAAGTMAIGLAGGIYFLKLFALPLSILILAALLITLGLCWYLRLNYALGAVVALIHDVLITVCIFSLLNKEFDLSIVAALLTIIGYSLNDTIIIFDRIRENLKAKASRSFTSTLNISINQTLSRTLLTSGTTLLVVLCLYILGGGVIHNFAFALLIGVISGTYSSIFVASPILLGFDMTTQEEEVAQTQAG